MIGDRYSTGFDRKLSFKTYKKMKLRMLEKDFYIVLTEEERARAEALTTEVQVDQFCLGILNNRWK